MESPDLLLSNDLPALSPVYLTEEPNHSISLYTGPLKVIQEGNVERGTVTVSLVWLPSPRVEFEFSSCNPCSIKLTNTSLKLLEHKVLVEVDILSLDPFGNEILGRPREPIVLGTGKELAHVLFHLTNFHDFIGCSVSPDSRNCRVVLEAKGWKITIDAPNKLRKLVESLEAQGGYAITHVGKLERSDGTEFPAKEAQELLEALSYFFSFARGFRSTAILPVGFDASGNRAWEKWDPSGISDPWQSVSSWFYERNSNSLAKVFPGFLQHWYHSTWCDPLRLVFHWYLASHKQAGAVQGSIILEQAALELLAWVVLMEKFNVSEKNLKDGANDEFNSPSKKINRLLERLGIPTEIPSGLLDLEGFGSTFKNNGPWALTELRNSIVHATPDNREKLRNTSFKTQCEAYELGLWYLDLVLLHLFDYRGSYFNRLYRLTTSKRLPHHDECIESVPWT